MKKLILLAAVVLFQTAVFAQTTWKVDKAHARLQFTVTHMSVSDVDGNFKDFDVVGGPFQSQSTNMAVTNGHMVQSQSFSLTYLLKPKHTGNLT
ncbi:MAG: BatD family protein, partial [Sphingobacteriales bacterium]